MRSTIRKAREAITKEPTSDQTKGIVTEATRTIDKMASKGVIHKNAAARYKSRLMDRFHKNISKAPEEQPPPETPPEEVEPEEASEEEE
jgi:ribosomal protein S20